eukprot:335320-Amphidinium_carterae.5
MPLHLLRFRAKQTPPSELQSSFAQHGPTSHCKVLYKRNNKAPCCEERLNCLRSCSMAHSLRTQPLLWCARWRSRCRVAKAHAESDARTRTHADDFHWFSVLMTKNSSMLEIGTVHVSQVFSLEKQTREQRPQGLMRFDTQVYDSNQAVTGTENVSGYRSLLQLWVLIESQRIDLHYRC